VSATFEATAPCRVDLAAAPEAVSVAIDRRAWCRVETGFAGLAVESKDTLQRIQASRLADLDANASVPVALAREALRAFGVDAGVRVVTQVKVPASSGLGGETALAVALVGALAHALGRDASKRDVEQVAAQVTISALGRAASVADVAAAVRGGCVACDAGRGPVAVAVDPAAVEECLMLAEAGGTNGAPAVVLDPEGHGSRVQAALVRRRFDDLASVLADDWDARCRVPGWATPERERVASLLRPAGAGLRACGAGNGTVVAVLAPPGERGPGRREAVVGAAKAASLRLFPTRVDVLGLDVEKIG
jgi:galactokinase/mevalonate kinase-like predicted kinase